MFSASSPDLFPSGWFAPLLLAPFVGSFAGVLIRRLPIGRDVVRARSRCDSCGQVLGARDLVPLASYLWLRGRCRPCKAAIGGVHTAVELAAIGIALAAIWVDDGDTAQIWADCVLGWTLLALAWIDWLHLRLPDSLTLPLLLAGLAATWILQPEAIGAHALGAALGFLSLEALARIYRRLRGREGIGRGDAKLLGAAGAWLGWQALPWVVLLAALAGLALVLGLRLRGVKLDAASALPFGPCLAVAIWAVFLYLP